MPSNAHPLRSQITNNNKHSLIHSKTINHYEKRHIIHPSITTVSTSTHLTEYNSIITYEDASGNKYNYTNNYQEKDPEMYVSTLDSNPFPITSDTPLIPYGTVIVWEKFNLVQRLPNLEIKLELIGKNGFTKEEFINMEKEVEFLERMLDDYRSESN